MKNDHANSGDLIFFVRLTGDNFLIKLDSFLVCSSVRVRLLFDDCNRMLADAMQNVKQGSGEQKHL
jgi:hypothetical protein